MSGNETFFSKPVHFLFPCNLKNFLRAELEKKNQTRNAYLNHVQATVERKYANYSPQSVHFGKSLFLDCHDSKSSKV